MDATAGEPRERRVRIDSITSSFGYATPERADGPQGDEDSTTSSTRSSGSPPPPIKAARRHRTISGSKSEDHLLMTPTGQRSSVRIRS
ncbi:hypothetical protein M3Y99_01495900 [Aphelenchoides fujianensis]|nr:hypothetical protein M3Y99_01495900 [Aphelenchoides fujianensis]